MSHALRRGRVTRAAAALAVLAVSATLAACSSDGSPSGATSDGTASADTVASAASATRAVDTAKGQVVVPTHPTRIVSIHSWSTEALFDLGATPIGVEDSGAEYVPSRYLSRWKAIDKVTDGGDVDLEKIAALKPDLIVGVDVPYLDADYQKLTQIAPTVLAPFSDTSTWQDYPTAVAGAIGADSQLAALKTTYEDEVAEIKADYAPQLAALRWDVIQGGFDAGNYWIYSTTSDVGDILTQLGAQFASATSAVKAGGTDSVSYEKANLLQDADLIVYYTNNDGTPANDIAKLFSLQAYKNLPAVKAGNVVGTADFLPGSYADAIGVLDSVKAALAKVAANG